MIERAQAFWAAIVAGHRVDALGFVLPEKRDVFLSGSPVPIIRAEVVGLDLTNRSEQAQVRARIETLSREAVSGQAGWEITDLWVWHGDNWYLDLRDAQGIFPSRSSETGSDITAIEKEIDQTFKLLRNPMDLGRLLEGQQLSFEIPIKYSGEIPLTAESEIANPLADLEASGQISSRTTNLVLLVNTEGWEGSFNLPLPIRIRNGAATVKRTLVIRGTVFAPITFRRDPADGPIQADRPISLFIRNNSSQEAVLGKILTDTTFEILKRPETLPPNTEGEVVLKLVPGASPDRLNLELTAPIEGRSLFTYRFRSSSR